MRTVTEWQGKTDDATAPASCKLRVLDRQGNACTCGVRFDAKIKPQFDHVSPLWLGGSNRESNLQALCPSCHGQKTKTEATARAKVNSLRKGVAGLAKPKSRPLGGTIASGWKKRMDGTVARR